MQVLYGILVQHFATVAGRTPLQLDHLDAMTHVLAPATAEVVPTTETLAPEVMAITLIRCSVTSYVVIA